MIALVPLLLALVAIALLGDGERTPRPTDTVPAGSDSAEALLAQADLPAEPDVAAVVLSSGEGALSPAQLDEVTALAADLGAPAPAVSDDGAVALAFVPLDTASPTESADAVERLRDRLAADTPDGIEALVTGPAAVQADLEAVFEGADLRLLGATALIVAFLLVVTYRSPVLWVVPLAVVGVADRLAAVLATQVLAALDVAFDESTTGILSILVFGAGTNYALLLISRYRAELTTTESRQAAMAVALRRTAEAVVTSAVTVVLGVLTLLLSLTPTTRGLGLASAIGITVAAAFVLVVLPAALVCCGRWVFWPRVPHAVPGSTAPVSPLWSRVGRAVSRSPRRVVVASVVVLGGLAVGLLAVQTGLDESEQFIDTPEAIVAAQRLGESFPGGAADPVRVVTRADPATVLTAVEGVDGVLSAEVAATGDGVSEIEAVLAAPTGSDDARTAVLDLREALAGEPDTFVAGTEASAIDEADGGRRDLLVIVPLVALLVLLVLGALLRAVVAPLVLVATVIATYAASLGAAWWVFTGLLDFAAFDTSVPLFAFVFLVALGVDYNIFLVTRAREEAAAPGTREGMLRALSATGGVITSAGILLAAVFTVLGVLPAVALAQIGVVICIGVLLDTLLVRTVLVPAIALILGDRFWWPRTMAS
ncbi:MMPL family transporter [Nocardioides sp. C4-1]|uniref:MMPL family transporter n=1 Tax=Nocardioides sp. C4-1 TaxID=3151851 RepID=UPI00326460F6